MAVRPPQNLSGNSRTGQGFNILEGELVAEQASTLGRAGRELERALDRLRNAKIDNLADETQPGDTEALLQNAADAAWALMIQRELCGLSTGLAMIRQYAIPQAVLNRIGIQKEHQSD